MTFLDPIKVKNNNPESQFKQNFKKFLEKRGWIVMYMPSSVYSMGWPDLLLCHPKFKCQKWVEAKVHGRVLRTTQINRFKELASCGVDVWVIEGDDKSIERDFQFQLELLFKPANWYMYIKT